MANPVKTFPLTELLKRRWATFKNQAPTKVVTEQYPLQRPPVAERYRGAPRLNTHPETEETLCISCNLCALACPEQLIVVTSVRNPETKRKDLTTFTYDVSRCMFCGLCEDACPVNALELTQDFELATYTREGQIWDPQMLEEGPLPSRYTHWGAIWRSRLRTKHSSESKPSGLDRPCLAGNVNRAVDCGSERRVCTNLSIPQLLQLQIDWGCGRAAMTRAR